MMKAFWEVTVLVASETKEVRLSWPIGKHSTITPHKLQEDLRGNDEMKTHAVCDILK